MKFLLGGAALVSCIVLSTFDVFLDSFVNNVAYWGVAISIVYLILNSRSSSSESA